ncbi:unnamed protein product, partial [Sphagnum jensenii]
EYGTGTVHPQHKSHHCSGRTHYRRQWICSAINATNEPVSPAVIFDYIQQNNKTKLLLTDIKNNSVGPIQEQAIELLNKTKKHIIQAPTKETPKETVAQWAGEIAAEALEAEKLLGVHQQENPDANPKKPSAEEIQSKVRLDIIRKATEKRGQVATHKTFANFGIYSPFISGTKIADKSLEGLGLTVPLTFLLDTYKAYFEAVQSYPDFSTNCREETCVAGLGTSQFSEIVQKDHLLIGMLVEKMEFALKLSSVPPHEMARLLDNRFENLQPKENFFFPVRWDGDPSGHAMALEIEKDVHGKMTMRLFNLGAGTQYHTRAKSEDKFLPFIEYVNIEPHRITGGAWTGFLDSLNASPPAGLKAWDDFAFYKIALASLGGELSSRKESTELFRESQYIGNCGVTSTLAILGTKNSLGNALAEKMRTIALFRIVRDYFEDNFEKFTTGDEKESHRQLFLGVIESLLESIQRTVEVGGFTPEEANMFIPKTVGMRNAIAKIQKEDQGTLAGMALAFDRYKTHVCSLAKAGNPLRNDIKDPKQLIYGESSRREIKVAANKELSPPEPLILSPLKDEALNKFIEMFGNQPDAHHQVETLTPIKFDEMFILGNQNAKNILSATSAPTLKITELLALFNQKKARYIDNDSLILLQRQINDPAALQKNLETDPGLIKAIGDFCNKGREIGHMIGSAETEVFYAYLLRIARRSVELLPQGHTIDFSALPDSFDIFSQLIADADHEQEEDRLKTIHYHRVKSFEKHTSLSIRETGELLTSISFLKGRGFPKDSAKPAVTLDRIWRLVESAQIHFEDEKNGNEILNSIARGFDPEHKNSEWLWYPLAKSYADAEKTMRYDPVTGVLDKQFIGKNTIPASLQNDPLFVSITNSHESRLDRIKKNIYVYTDPIGNQYRFITENTPPSIQRKFNNNWYEAVDPNGKLDLKIAFEAGEQWHEGGVLWYPLDYNSGILYFTGHGGAPILKLDTTKIKSTLGGAGNYILGKVGDAAAELMTSSGQGTDLMLINTENTSISQVIQGLENPKYFFAFSKGDKLSYVKLTRYDLEFEADNQKNVKNDQLICKKLDGFGLYAGKQPVPLLGDFPYYLHLKKSENQQEEDGVIIPSLPFAPQESGGLRSPTAFIQPAGSWKIKIPYFFYRVKENQLIPQASSMNEALLANLHIATIFLSERRYVEAANYLSAVDKLMKAMNHRIDKEITDKLLVMMTFSSLNHDTSQSAAAIHLQAASMLFRLIDIDLLNLTQIGSVEDYLAASTEQLNKDYALYSQHINRVPAQLLLSGEQCPFWKIHSISASVPKKRLANQLGLDPNLTEDPKFSDQFRTSIITLLELRYRFLIDLIDSNPQADKLKMRKFGPEEINKLQSEMNLVGALLNTADLDSEKFELDIAYQKDLAASLRTAPEFVNEINTYDRYVNKVSEKNLAATTELWLNWVAQKANPFKLSVPRAQEPTESFVGPVQIGPMLELTKENKNAHDFAVSYAASITKNRPATFLYGAALTNRPEIEACFTKTTTERIFAPSPFAISGTVTTIDPALAETFKKQDDHYQQFVKQQPGIANRYTLIKEDSLREQVKVLTTAVADRTSNIESSKDNLLLKLNKKPLDPSLRIHTEVKLARGVLRGLTVADAKAALARGWDIQHLHAINPNLSVADIGEIFEMTLTLMLEERENQRLVRAINALDTIMAEKDKGAATWHAAVDKLIQSLSQSNFYDPYDHPVLLLAETEFNIALWPEQIPAILRLAPRQQISALVELAMGLGKTDIITPAVLCLMADGHTLPILVMPEALIATAAAKLQERSGKGYHMEVRVIPIDRGLWTDGKVDSLRDEMSLMIEQRIPLIWSSTDIQTLINSFIESMKEIHLLTKVEALGLIRSWQTLFQLMRSAGEIIGDEIHAILDILTSYNFSLGDPQSISIDEMDAVIDFIKVVLGQPGLNVKKTFPFLRADGKPLNEDFFNQELKPKIIESLIKKGIINDPRSKELLEISDTPTVENLKKYLSGEFDASFEKKPLFPVIDESQIKKLEKGAIPLDQINILPSDRKKLNLLEDNLEDVCSELRLISEEYKQLDKRLYNYLAVQKESLRIVFSYTSTAQLGKHYVLNKQGNSAIPADNGTPLWDSQFGSSLERLFFTAFLFAQHNISEEVILNDLKAHGDRYAEKVVGSISHFTIEEFIDLDLLNDQLIKDFKIRYGEGAHLKTRPYTKAEIDQFVEYVNSNFERQLPFIRDQIFPKLKIYHEQIETSTHMFPAIVKPGFGLRGMTGTLYNKDTFPHELSRNNFLSDTNPMVTEKIKSCSAPRSLRYRL